MSKYFTLRVSSQMPERIQWFVWSKSSNNLIAKGEAYSEQELASLFVSVHMESEPQRSVDLLIDTRDTLLTKVKVPSGGQRQLDKMLPFLLEDELAQEVEILHFTLLNKKELNKRELNKSDKWAQVAVIEQSYLQKWLDFLNPMGIEVKKALPDVFALPYLQQGISAIKINNHWLLRKGKNEGLAVEEQWLEACLTSDWCSNGESQLSITHYCQASNNSYGYQGLTSEELDKDKVGNDKVDSNKTNSDKANNKQPGIPQWLIEPLQDIYNPETKFDSELVMLSRGALYEPTNLLSGPFKVQSSLFKPFFTWTKVLSAACLLFLVICVQLLVESHYLRQQASELRTESERVFSTIFPDKRKIPTVGYLKNQMDSEINRLSQQGPTDSVIQWLLPISAILNRNEPINITAIRFDARREEMRIDALMKDFQSFEVIRAKLVEDFQVNQGPLVKQDKQVRGSFTLRRKL